MAVMEHVQSAKPWGQSATQDQREALQRALALMKENQLVHGDLRAPNVLLSGDKGVFIIDFEFSGKEGKVKLPYNIAAWEFNTVRAERGDPITTDLDKKMANLLLAMKKAE